MVIAVGHLEQRRATAPGEELGDVAGLAATEPDDAPVRRERLGVGDELVEIEGRDPVDPGKVLAELAFEGRPQVVHGHDEAGPVGDELELADEPAAEDRRERRSGHALPRCGPVRAGRESDAPGG